MSDLKTEIIKHKAKRILNYYKRENIKFNTALYDDESSIKEVDNKLLFFNYKTKDISLDFANAVIDYDNTLDYHNMFVRHLSKESANKEGFLMFTNERKVDERIVEETKFYTNLTKSVLNTFLQKQDTPEFRENVSKMNEIFQSDLNVVAEGDYGVVFFYKLGEHPEFQPDNQKFLKDFAKEIERQKQEREKNKQKQERER